MKENIKIFIIKLFCIVVAIVLVINSTYNLIFADKIEAISQIFSVSENKQDIKNKIRKEINRSLTKEKIFEESDRKLLRKFYLKLKNEFELDK